VALILAINPGNSHSPTLARLARELKGHELIGADSCAIAITAIRKRVPDLVLLPDTSPRGEAELLAQLRAVPGGVTTRKLPPVQSADPVALAKEIRAILTREPKVAAPPVAAPPVAAPPVAAPLPAPTAPAGPSPHLIAAANAAISWIHTRRTQWAAEAAASIARTELNDRHEPNEPHEPHDPHDPHDPDEPDRPSSPMAVWLPRVAVVAALIGAAAAVVSFWPVTGGNATNGVATVSTPAEAPPPAETPPAAGPSDPPALVPAPADPALGAKPDPVQIVSGWIAVSAPFDVAITSGNAAIPVDEKGRAMLEPGKHRLRFQNRELGYDETRTVEVRPTATTTVNLLADTTIGITATEPAEVLIDGAPAGVTPFEGRMLLGTRTVTVRSAGSERQFTIEATMKPVRLEVDFSKP